tara:strand:- start:46 stop:381 length:336 start_codon:yes stop_codon:yes gene_type:complete
MSAGIHNFTLEQGTTFQKVITVKQDGSALNLSGYQARSQLRTTHDASTKALDFTVQVTEATNGKITISATASDTAGVEEGIYVYDLEIESSGGVVTRLIEGKVTVTPEVTR